MPSIDELMKKGVKKKFVKTSYRPYDYDIRHREEQARNLKIDSETGELLDDAPVQDQALDLTVEKNISNDEQERVGISSAIINEDWFVKNEDVKENVISVRLDPKFKDSSLGLAYSVLKKKEIRNLVGVQKKIFFTIFNTCVKEGALGTISYTAKDFQEITGASLGTVKSALDRLFKKNLLLRLEGKRAKGGYLYIGFDKEVWDVCMQMVNEDRDLVD